MHQRQKNKDADFGDLIAEYGHIVNKVCYMYAHEPADFEDIRQEAYINLWRGLDSFRGDAALRTWVYRVTLNSCVSFFRKNPVTAVENTDSLYRMVADTTDQAAMLAEMHVLINRLNRIEKAVILLWLDDYPYDAIAEIMGMPRNTVASYIRRIREKLVKFSNQ